jgi:pimeloyl-ACP methyl ester carboxylesterase
MIDRKYVLSQQQKIITDKKMKAILYIHGMGGSAIEAELYREFFTGDVIGLEYDNYEPWTMKEVVAKKYKELTSRYDEISVIANSIGAYFAMLALGGKAVSHAYFISPMVDMEKFFLTKMKPEEIDSDYLAFVCSFPICWDVPTDILYGSDDHLIDLPTMQQFADKHGATLTIMPHGEHWFHTSDQIAFLKKWIKEKAI